MHQMRSANLIGALVPLTKLNSVSYPLASHHLDEVDIPVSSYNMIIFSLWLNLSACQYKIERILILNLLT